MMKNWAYFSCDWLSEGFFTMPVGIALEVIVLRILRWKLEEILFSFIVFFDVFLTAETSFVDI